MTHVKAEPIAPPKGAEIPPFKTSLHWIRKHLIITIQLHNIPDKHISLEVTNTHFHLHTMSYTKKYNLKFRFPNKIKVDENDVEVDFDGGILTVGLHITQLLDTKTGKLLAFKGKTKSKATAPIRKAEEEDDYEDDAESQGEEDEDAADEEESQDASEGSEEVVEAPKKRSKAPASKETALKLLDELSQKEDAKRAEKLKKEASKEAYLEKKTAEREASKEAKKSAREAKMKELFAAHQAEKKAAKEPAKKSKRLVQFEDDEEVAPPTKKPKHK